MIFDLFFEKKVIPKLNITKPIDILIPIYNGKEYVLNLLNSIINNTSLPYRLIICNDNSSDNSIKEYLNLFKKEHPNQDITIIHNKENLGFIKTINKLSEMAKNHFIILNSDTKVPPFWVERLIYPILANDKIASVTPFSNAGSICSFPEIDKDNELFEKLDLEILDSYFQYVNYENCLFELPTAVGFCMAINKDTWQEIGGFDESFGKGYGEENDWSMRALKLGYKNVIAPNLFIYHKHGGSFKNKEKKILMEKNTNLLIKKHPEYPSLVVNFFKKDPLKILRILMKIKILSDLYGAVFILNSNINNNYKEKLLICANQELIDNSYSLEIYHRKIGSFVLKFKKVKFIQELVNFLNIVKVI